VFDRHVCNHVLFPHQATLNLFPANATPHVHLLLTTSQSAHSKDKALVNCDDEVPILHRPLPLRMDNIDLLLLHCSTLCRSILPSTCQGGSPWNCGKILDQRLVFFEPNSVANWKSLVTTFYGSSTENKQNTSLCLQAPVQHFNSTSSTLSRRIGKIHPQYISSGLRILIHTDPYALICTTPNAT
jgi:hypothetical protein